MAYVMETGETLEHHDLKELIKAVWSFLRLASREQHPYHIEFSRYDQKDQRWEYMGQGKASPGFCAIIGQFTRSFSNYYKSGCTYYRIS